MPQGRTSPLFHQPVLEARHQPTGLNLRFSGASLDFAGYVARSREMLAKAHAGKPPRERELAVAGNAPFESAPGVAYAAGREKPYLRGVLLVHGLTDSPYFMRYMASFFQQRGFRVMAILLPGHGTQPGDLLDMHWQEWARATAWGADCMAEEAEEVYIAGYSAGATLAARHALLDKRVRGLFLFSPAFRISPRAGWANLHKIYSWLVPSAKWVDIKPDEDPYKYESFPKNAAYQMHALTRDLHARLQQQELGMPVLAAASADDATVDSSATVAAMARAKHPASRLVYYAKDPSACPSGIPESRVELMSSVVPGQNIVSFSHLSILLPAEDTHYGLGGDYANCLHYYPADMEKFAACRGGSPAILRGEVTEQNLHAGVLCRLTYNPHFAALQESMRRFIEDLP